MYLTSPYSEREVTNPLLVWLCRHKHTRGIVKVNRPSHVADHAPAKTSANSPGVAVAPSDDFEGLQRLGTADPDQDADLRVRKILRQASGDVS